MVSSPFCWLAESPGLVGLQGTRDRNLCPTSTSTSTDTLMNTPKQQGKLAACKSEIVNHCSQRVTRSNVWSISVPAFFLTSAQAVYFNLRWSRKHCETKSESPTERHFEVPFVWWSDQTGRAKNSSKKTTHNPTWCRNEELSEGRKKMKLFKLCSSHNTLCKTNDFWNCFSLLSFYGQVTDCVCRLLCNYN